ncbi:MAG: ubiquinone/menaquinone biosynthesis methyltransferase [Phycisphaerae bacterium]|jgi:demethylmenaquinone methyltransferase/2-methoxy-6-polyprenyl-1,4-benzoquinol methylase
MNSTNDQNIPNYISQPELKREYNEKLFGRIAAKYDLLNRILSFGSDGKWKRAAVSMLPNEGVNSCLDVACGTGDLTVLLAEKYTQAKICGLDLTAKMLDIAKKKVGNKKNEFVIGDMCDMPFGDNCFDVVTAFYAIRNAPDLERALDEIIRVTRPGGCICLLDFSKPVNKFMQAIELAALKLWCGLCGRVFYRGSNPYSYIVPSLRAFPDSKQLKEILQQHGYILKQSHNQAFGMIKILICEKC